MSRPSSGTIRRTSSRTMLKLQAAIQRAVGLTEIRRRRSNRKRRTRRYRPDPTLARHWQRAATTLLRFGGASTGNRIRLFCDGDDMFETLWNAIDHAQQHIFFEMYIIEPDRVGKRTLEALTRAAQRGVGVHLLYDAVGSSNLTEKNMLPLRNAGAAVTAFNPLWRWRRTQPFLRRDHRKIIVVDGRVGFCGGMNIADAYAGAKYGTGYFRDCHAQVEGPCVRDLAAVFASSWRMATDERLALPRRPAEVDGTLAQVLGSKGWQGRHAIQRSLRIAIHNSVEKCYITSPYFVPPWRLMKAITSAARRGVDVRILTAGSSDVPIVAAAARHIYGHLLKQRVRIFELYGQALHAKTVTIDGLYGTVGSFNLDKWSHERNLEVNIASLNTHVAQQIEDQFIGNIKDGKEITLDTWQKRTFLTRFVQWLAYQILKL